MKTANIVLPGRPYTKKNSQRIIIKPGSSRPMIIQSRQYRAYQEACLWELKAYRGPTFEGRPLELTARYFMDSRRSWPDILGLLQATADILEAADIIDDDQNVISFDGSRIVGVDSADPRAEVRLREVAPDARPEHLNEG